MKQLLDLNDALMVLKSVLERISARGGELPKSVVMVGGTALAAHGVRDLSKDVDFYSKNIDETIIYEVEKEFRQIHGRLFKIDVTSSEAIWGRVILKDLEQSPKFTTMSVGQQDVEVKMLTVEDLFFLKLGADREKDRRDLPGLVDRTTSDALTARFNQLIDWMADKNAAMGFMDRFVDVMEEYFELAPQRLMERLELPVQVKDMLLASRVMEGNDGSQEL
ncbi:hypothetical protein N825_15560 [Skermanella stibiiresistens SB22]|uniref:DUF6036 domain-containing protein n=1 Tax=Skermanella stibiiresistens SB22 TaxID=1385369 RepID=W9GWA1_9PROT|nr:DUF6036 family nucleotidyltransferase [Skermanella stibiiresistens]EWY38094.1 hypothetical protein N825_15560 [Skermanella stibiiresistens SB22]